MCDDYYILIHGHQRGYQDGCQHMPVRMRLLKYFWLMIYDPFFLNNNVIKQWHGYRPDPTSIPAFHYPDMVMGCYGSTLSNQIQWRTSSLTPHKNYQHLWPQSIFTGGRYTSPDIPGIPDPHSIIGQGRGPHLQALQLGCCNLTKGGPMSWWFQSRASACDSCDIRL